jgi:NTP pyrophosphatase (non-canonical NTP hydrolase)
VNDLIRSTFALHERFGTAQDWQQAMRIFIEEKHEFFEAYRDGDTDAAAEEAVDVIVTMLGLARVAGCTEAQLTHAVEMVCAKNDAKTHETHVVDDESGKITRIR